jgi:hypothetical protein
LQGEVGQTDDEDLLSINERGSRRPSEAADFPSNRQQNQQSQDQQNAVANSDDNGVVRWGMFFNTLHKVTQAEVCKNTKKYFYIRSKENEKNLKKFFKKFLIKILKMYYKLK